MFVTATIVPINMGILAFVGAFLVGTLVADETKAIAAGFPAELFLALVGITYLFATPRTTAPSTGSFRWRARGAGTGGGDPVDHVLRGGDADRGRRGQSGRGRHHRAHRVGFAASTESVR